MRALIVAHGEPPSRRLLRALKQNADTIIATDGAANGMIRARIPPHIVFGDFDSLESGIMDRHPDIQYVIAPSQEASDLDKAVAYALELGAASVVLAGAGGGRVDHTLANVSLLIKYRGVDIRLIDDHGVTLAVQTHAEFEGWEGDTLSLIPFEPVRVRGTQGLRWPLRDELLLPGSRGVSNVFTEHTASVSLESGIIIACHLRNPDAVRSGDR